ncbi:hypothetical protein MRX96_054544 [Rhipicephalus microplus]
MTADKSARPARSAVSITGPSLSLHAGISGLPPRTDARTQVRRRGFGSPRGVISFREASCCAPDVLSSIMPRHVHAVARLDGLRFDIERPLRQAEQDVGDATYMPLPHACW